MWVGFIQSAEVLTEQRLNSPKWKGILSAAFGLKLQLFLESPICWPRLSHRGFTWKHSQSGSSGVLVVWPMWWGHVLWRQAGRVLSPVPPFTTCMILNNWTFLSILFRKNRNNNRAYQYLLRIFQLQVKKVQLKRAKASASNTLMGIQIT